MSTEGPSSIPSANKVITILFICVMALTALVPILFLGSVFQYRKFDTINIFTKLIYLAAYISLLTYCFLLQVKLSNILNAHQNKLYDITKMQAEETLNKERNISKAVIDYQQQHLQIFVKIADLAKSKETKEENEKKTTTEYISTEILNIIIKEFNDFSAK